MSISGNLDPHLLKFELNLNQNDQHSKSLDIVFCNKILKINIDSFIYPNNYFNNVCSLFQNMWNYFRGKKIVIIDVPQDIVTEKAIRVAINVLDLEQFIGHERFRKVGLDVIEVENEKIIEEIKFKAFSRVFFSYNAATRKEAWAKLSNSLSNFENIMGFINDALESDPRNWKKIPEEFLCSESSAAKRVKSILKQAILSKVQLNGLALSHAPDLLKNDRSITFIAFLQNPYSLKFAGKNAILAAVCSNGNLLRYANEQLKDDKEVVLAALSKSSFALEYASDLMQNDKEVVLAAVKGDGLALQYASEPLQQDKEVVIAAVSQNPLAMQFAHDDLKNDLDVALAALKQDARIIVLIGPALRTHPLILDAIVYSSISDNLCKIKGKRYFPKALSLELQQLQLPTLKEDATVERLKANLSTFIDELNDLLIQDTSKLRIVRNELGLPHDTSLEVCIAKLRDYHALLFERSENKLAYLGTPPEGSQELNDFYKQIEFYLCHLDVFLSNEENKMPNALIERLQLLQTQEACGARFQAEIEQLFSLNCITSQSMALANQLAHIASSQAKKAIESITPSRDSHAISIKTFQLNHFLVGEKIVRDQLGQLFEERSLLIRFLGYHTAKNLVETIQQALKSNSTLDQIFSDYLKENFLPQLSDLENAEIERQLADDWQTRKEKKIEDFRQFQIAKLENNRGLMRRLHLREDEIACLNQEEFEKLMESKKENFLNSFKKAMVESYQIKKLYDAYFDGSFESSEGLRLWKAEIIAKAIEKMGILEVMR